ncbi:MAG: hypothetical protein VW397_01565 [Candidatus Margulisiibacteriota bacterium]
MAKPLTLFELYENYEKEALIERLREIVATKMVVPVGDMIRILEESMEIDLVALIIEALMKRLTDIDDILLDVYPKTNDVVKNHLITIFCTAMRSKYMQFILNEYFFNPYMRPMIRKQAFANKKFLFMNLVRYFEDLPMNYDNVMIAQQILKTIPRDIVIGSRQIFSGTQLMDVYFAMPPDVRKKK